jgi:hypothetical protein
LLGLLGATSIEGLAQNTLREGLSLARSLARLPRQLDRLIEKAEKGELRIIVEPTIESQRGRGRGRGRRMRANVAAIETLYRPVPLWAPLGMIGVAGLWALIAIARGRRTTYRAARSRNHRSA